MPRRVLMLMSQLPQDPTSGAAVSMLGTARVLAASGFEVRALSTTAIEGSRPLQALPFLAQLGNRVEVDRRAAVGRGRPVLRFAHGGVKFTALDTGAMGLGEWDFVHGVQFNRLLLHELEKFAPDVVLTIGGTPPEQARREMVRAGEAVLVFGLYSLAYLHHLAFGSVDAVLTPSAFLSGLYRETIGLESTAIPPPVELGEIVAPKREAKYFTFVNPTPAKGVFFFATLAAVLADRRPDIPLQVIEGRGLGEHLIQAGLAGQFDLRRHPNLRIVTARARPRDVFADCRAILAPSLGAEPFGRLAMESLHNGVPAVVSGRGGLAEASAEGGIVLPILKGITERTASPVSDEAAAEWAETIVRLHDDGAFYDEACARARGAAGAFDPVAIAQRHAAFFANVRHAQRPVAASREG